MNYSDIPPARFLLGLAIVSAPLFLIDERYQRSYVLLMLVTFALFNLDGIGRMTAYFRQELTNARA